MTGYEASMLHSTHAAKPIHRIGLHRSGALQLQYFLQELCKKNWTKHCREVEINCRTNGLDQSDFYVVGHWNARLRCWDRRFFSFYFPFSFVLLTFTKNTYIIPDASTKNLVKVLSFILIKKYVKQQTMEKDNTYSGSGWPENNISKFKLSQIDSILCISWDQYSKAFDKRWMTTRVQSYNI